MAKASAKIKFSTQQHLDFDDITDDLIIFKTGWVGLVMSTTAVNFDLLSEAEQDATIYAYGAFLNSLTFPIEILVRSKKADITAYFNNLEEAEKTQPNSDIKRQIQKYRDFIQSIVQQRAVLDKKFYIIINFSPLELGFKGLGRRNVQMSKSKKALIQDAKAALFPKRDHIIKQLARLGLTARQLTTQELIELFYDIYNPAPTGTQRVILDSASYTIPIVEPAVEVPSPAPSGVGPAPAPADLEQASAPTTDQWSPPTAQDHLRPAPPPQSNVAGKSDLPPSNAAGTLDVPPAPTPPVAPPQPVDQQNAAAEPKAPVSNLSAQQAAALSSLQQAAAQATQFVERNNTQAAVQNSRQEPKPNI